MKKRGMIISNFVCPDCSSIFPLMRKQGQMRMDGHKKTLWCPFCKRKRQFEEIKPGQFFEKQDGAVIF